MRELLTVMDTKYKRLEYIQSTGTQYIDTGYYLQSNTLKVKTKFNCDFTNQAEKDFIGNQDNTTNRFVIGTYQGKIFAYSRKQSGSFNTLFSSNIFSGQQTIDLEVFYDWNNHTRTIIANGITTEGDYDHDISPSNSKISLFNNGVQGNFFIGKTYFIQIYDNGILVRNFIPVLRKSDNEIGMLDLVEGKFYPNAGTGKFTANLDTMYAIIQGTPTVQDGRVSGFSSSNYLKLQQQLDATKPFELVAKINISSIGSSQTVFGTSTSTYIQLGVRGTGVAMLLLGQGGASFNVGTLYGTTVLSTNTDYWIKGKFTGTKYELYLSTDGINWNLEKSIESSTLISNSPITLQMGNGHTDNWYLRGTIALNRSYIKIDDTKYKLQAVVGYTVVGSPTITDGVVSGFTDSNYLQLQQQFTLSPTTKAEFCFKINVSSFDTLSVFCGSDILRYFYFGVNNSGRIMTVFGDGSSWTNIKISNTILSLNTDYEIKVKIDNNIATVYVNGNIELNFNIGLETTNTFNVRIGKGRSVNDYFDGTIDLNETYIKVNNKLWFNGLAQ